jgi:photosystem II stability/assembly factor-like uncharacterized protein
MKSIYLIIISAIIFLHSLDSQWQQSYGIYNGTIRSFTVRGSRVFAGTELKGIYVSSNYGNYPWAQTMINDKTVLSMASNNFYVFAGTADGIIYRSIDTGSTWNSVLSINYSVNSICMLDSNIYAGTSNGIFLSFNNGITWNQHPMNGQTVYSLIVKQNVIYAATQTYGVYKTTNNGLNWIQTGLNNQTVLSLALCNNIIFAGTEQNGILKSIDNGQTWAAVNDQKVNSFAVAGNNIYAATYLNGVYRSTNFGQNWSYFGLSNTTIYSIGLNSSIVLAGTHRKGINYTDNGGANWASFLSGAFSFSFARKESSLYSGTSDGVFKSTNNGLNWFSIGLNEQSVTTIVAIGNRILAGVHGDGLYFTDDEGANWIYAGFINNTILAMAVSRNIIFASTHDNGVYRSTDNGINWNSTGIYNQYIYGLAADSNAVFAGTESQGIYKSTNFGDNWINVSPIYFKVESILIKDQTIYAGTYNGIYYSTNYGTDWQYRGLTSKFICALAFQGNRIFAGSKFYGEFISTDNGVTWTGDNEGLPEYPSINTLFIFNNSVFAGTRWNSIWHKAVSEIGVISLTNEIPNRFSLSQNYPNPFNPQTKIKFAVPSNVKGQTSNVKLIIYDLLGREVATLVNEELKPGTYEADWDGSNYSSGVYFYKIISGDFVETKKMVLMK